MNKNLLRVTTVLCSLAIFSSFTVSAVTKGSHKPTGNNVTVQSIDNQGIPEKLVTTPDGNQIYVGGYKSDGSAEISASSGTTDGSASLQATEGEDLKTSSYNEQTNRNSSKQFYNNGDGTYSYDTARGEGESEYGSSYEQDGTVKSGTVGNGSADTYKSHSANGNSRTIVNDATKGQGDTRTSYTTKDGTTVEVQSTTTSSGTTATVSKNGQEEGTATSTHNSDGTTTVTTSTGKSTTVSK